jgi:hypothetical protein
VLDWVFRGDAVDDGDLGLAVRKVRQYERLSPSGKPEVVRGYQAQHHWWGQPRSWWIPHPDWERGQQEWITAGEKGWARTGKENWARGEAAAREAEHGAGGARGTPAGSTGKEASRAGLNTERTAEKAEHGTAKPVTVPRTAHGGATPRPQLPEHGYLRPDPARLERTRGTYKRPQDHPFFKKNPLSAENVRNRYGEATEAEKHQGMRWYEDMHRLAWALGGGDAARGAGVLAALSPQTGWPINMFNAARYLAEGRPEGKMQATGDMRKSAERILAGEHPNDVLKSPKTNAFGVLGALGADHPEDEHGRVVVDRHAMSVAAGKRLTKEDVSGKGENATPIGDDFFYEHVADMYRHAARDISEQTGQEIAPHQLQAITWLVQQRMNEAGDIREGKGKGLRTNMRNAWNNWGDYAREHGLRTELGTTSLPPTPITRGEVAASGGLETGGGPSRPVSAAEFHDIATQGRQILDDSRGDSAPPEGLVANWESLKAQAWAEVQLSWGGMTIDARTGEPLPQGADKFATTVKPPGIETMSIPEGGTEAQFDKAMDAAFQRFEPLLERAGYHLGIFHDDATHRIDFDPVFVSDTQSQAEAIGAYTHNVGGSYHFASGNGYWPPHIQGQ